MEKSDGKKNVLEIFPEVEAVIKVWQWSVKAVDMIQLFHEVIKLCAVFAHFW
jgi:hypothetical protein